MSSEVRDKPASIGQHSPTHEVDLNLLDLRVPSCEKWYIFSLVFSHAYAILTIVAEDLISEIDDPPALDISELGPSASLPCTEILWP